MDYSFEKGYVERRVNAKRCKQLGIVDREVSMLMCKGRVT